MVSGHTERSTINERKPLTPLMASLLRHMRRVTHVAWSDLSASDKNCLRGLMDRGYVMCYDHDTRLWFATDAGKEVELD